MMVYLTYLFIYNVTLRRWEFGSGREKSVVTPLSMKPFRCLERWRTRYLATPRHIADLPIPQATYFEFEKSTFS